VDFVAWPASYKPAAVLLAMDASGKLAFCGVDDAPETGQLGTPPTTSYADLPALYLDQGNIYVLDPAGNMIWVYWNESLTQVPDYYFGEEEKPLLSEAVDMVVVRNELYLLNKTGQVTVCYSGEWLTVPVRCPQVPFTDFRPGRENNPLTPTNPFTTLIYNPPPDPSLLFLQPESQGVYHFSLRSLGFLREYLPQNILPGGAATALTFDPFERRLLIAVRNAVYYASLP
jgi:hypothetical protein